MGWRDRLEVLGSIPSLSPISLIFELFLLAAPFSSKPPEDALTSLRVEAFPNPGKGTFAALIYPFKLEVPS